MAELSYHRKRRYLLCPTGQYMKMLLWILLLFVLILSIVSILFGQYVGTSIGIIGGLTLGIILIGIFGLTLLFYVVLVSIFDERENRRDVMTGRDQNHDD